MTDVPVSGIELANAIERWMGGDAAAYVAERIDALARSGNTDGLRRLEEIAAHLDRRRADAGEVRPAPPDSRRTTQ